MKKNLERVRCWRCGSVRYKSKLKFKWFWECKNKLQCKLTQHLKNKI